MTTNEGFLRVIKTSFETYLKTSPRSNEKLKPLHSCIARDIKELCGPEYRVKSLGIGDGTEESINGHYYPKKVDITVLKQGKPVAGIGVKFVMSNYSQNNINYFESMLGETANIRTASVPYFEVFIIFDKVPYFNNSQYITKYDQINSHNLKKYIALSYDDAASYFHTPDKTLICILSLKEKGTEIKNKGEYTDYYLSVINDSNLLSYSKKVSDEFGNNVILNDYEDFMNRVHATIEGKLKVTRQ